MKFVTDTTLLTLQAAGSIPQKLQLKMPTEKSNGLRS
jgi:hypothetical protein